MAEGEKLGSSFPVKPVWCGFVEQIRNAGPARVSLKPRPRPKVQPPTLRN